MTIPLHDYPDWQRSLSTADFLETVEVEALPFGDDFLSGVFDMRPYQSFAFRLDAELSEAATDLGHVYVVITWWTDSTLTQETYIDSFAVFPAAIGDPNFEVGEDQTYLQDAVHGPFMQYQVVNYGPDDIDITVVLTGNTRPMPGPYLRSSNRGNEQDSGATTSLLLATNATLAATGVTAYPLRIAPGLVWLRLQAVTTNHEITILNPGGKEVDFIAVGAGTTLRQTMIFPNETMLVVVENVGAVDGTHFIAIVHERKTW